MAGVIVTKDGGRYRIPDALVPQAEAAGFEVVPPSLEAPAIEEPSGAEELAPPSPGDPAEQPSAPGGLEAPGGVVEGGPGVAQAIAQSLAAAPARHGYYIIPREPLTQSVARCKFCGLPFAALSDEPKDVCRDCARERRGAR